MSKIWGMRGFLASSTGVLCAVLTLSLAPPASAAAGPIAGAAVPGSTQSLPLVPLAGSRAPGAAAERGLAPRTVHSFSLVGVVWDDPAVELHGRVLVRTRANGTGRWSGWQELEVHNQDHGPDPDTAEGRSNRMRGSTAPLWVGDSDGVQVWVRADEPGSGTTRAPRLPEGLRVELVDPGKEPRDAIPPPSSPPTGGSDGPDAEVITSVVDGGLAPLNALGIPGTSKRPTAMTEAKGGKAGKIAMSAGLPRQPYVAPRPRIVSRSGWGADESLREGGFLYTDTVKAAFVHHTATGNNYGCSQAPSVIRSIYRYHVVSSGWRDIGYNFLVDKCGTIYEGRAGGVEKPVMGAHTLGFNSDTTGIAVIGSYDGTAPSAAAADGLAQLTAWKLGLFGRDPRAKTYLVSGGGNLYPKGENVRLNVISGHRDGYATECPGRLLYGELGLVRSVAARYQGR
ncbi:peptidoglycan recognition protein family protein [Streptomyces glomeratus]|uniref:N-acetylmuramoyl-L-alanine amidase n=1 Tax=Streptomyces glomeratus TaxID=284452 RepID=A0ABP6M4F7_9ACTN|nr:peptidoglycan recognition protein [Streptomyces glomeratus]MCF1506399.1 peptidoglycan recognition protein [Streptomyces glomeratus]